MSTTAILTCGNHISVLVAGEEGALPISVVQGQTGPAWSLTFKTADNAAFDLTAAVFTSGVLFDQQVVQTGGLALAGTFATVSAANGTATFTPNTADTALKGSYTLEVKITKGGLVHFFRCPVEIVERYMT